MKFIWGGIADYFIRYGRKKFIVIGGLIGAFCLFALVFIDPAISLVPFVFFLILSHVGVSFIDVSADALAIQVSEEEERGKINGAMYAGLFIGSASSTILLGMIASIYSYNFAFFITGIVVLLIIVFPLFVKEEVLLKKRQHVGLVLFKEFKKRTIQLITILGPISSISAGIIFFVIPLYMKNVLNLTLAQTTIIASMFPIMMAVGSIIGGFITDKFGRIFALYLFLGGSAIVFASLIFGGEWITFIIIYGLVGLFIGGYHAASSALIMDITNPKIGATQYSFITSIFNVGEWTGGTLGGTFVSLLGYSRAFLYSGWFFGPALLLLYFIQVVSRKK